MLEPFLKWPGGKRWLVRNYAYLLPSHFERYIEPFLGGGAMFFHLLPRSAMLSDANADLVGAYNGIKAHWRDLDRILRSFHKRHSAPFYYKVRLSRPRQALSKAARFLYLNRTCFNGI